MEPRARALAHVRKPVAELATASSGILAWALSAPLKTRGQSARSSPAFPEFARKVGFAELWVNTARRICARRTTKATTFVSDQPTTPIQEKSMLLRRVSEHVRKQT